MRPNSNCRSRSGCPASCARDAKTRSPKFFQERAIHMSFVPRNVINRAQRPFVAKSEIGAAATVAAPGRIGIEFYDPAARFGAMASFDVGGAGMGARIMMLFDRQSRGIIHRRGPSDTFGERRHSRPALAAARGRIDRPRVPRTRRDRARRNRVLEHRTRAGFGPARRRHGSRDALRDRSRRRRVRLRPDSDFVRHRRRTRCRRASRSGAFQGRFASTAPRGRSTDLRARECRSPDWDRRSSPRAG